MKNIDIYLSESLKINKDSASKLYSKPVYTVRPSNRNELKTIIADRLKEDKDADLNDIDVSNITDMSELFYGLDPHNIKIDQCMSARLNICMQHLTAVIISTVTYLSGMCQM